MLLSLVIAVQSEQKILGESFFGGAGHARHMERHVCGFSAHSGEGSPFLVIALRFSGKRELVQLNPFDLVVLLTLSNTVQNAIIGDDNSVTGGLIGAASLMFTNYLVVRFLYNHRKLDQLVEGKADVLIENGKVRPEHLHHELITSAQLEAAARKQGFASLAEVDQCILEPGGTLSFIGKKPRRRGEASQRVAVPSRTASPGNRHFAHHASLVGCLENDPYAFSAA